MRARSLSLALIVVATLQVVTLGPTLARALTCPPGSCCAQSVSPEGPGGCGGAGPCCRIEAPAPRPPIVRADRAPLLPALLVSALPETPLQRPEAAEARPVPIEAVARSAPLHLLHARLNV